MDDLTTLQEVLTLVGSGSIGGALLFYAVRSVAQYMTARRQTEPEILRARSGAEIQVTEFQIRQLRDMIDMLSAEAQAEKAGRIRSEEEVRRLLDENARQAREIARLTGNGGRAPTPPRTPPG